MILSKPLVPKHADGVLRVYCPKRASTVERDAAAVDASRRDDAKWLGGVYAGPVAYFHPPDDSDKSISSLMAMIDDGPYDLVLLGETRELARSPELTLLFMHNLVDTGVRLIVWRDGIDTASDDWQTKLLIAKLRQPFKRKARRRRKGVASPNS